MFHTEFQGFQRTGGDDRKGNVESLTELESRV